MPDKLHKIEETGSIFKMPSNLGLFDPSEIQKLSKSGQLMQDLANGTRKPSSDKPKQQQFKEFTKGARIPQTQHEHLWAKYCWLIGLEERLSQRELESFTTAALACLRCSQPFSIPKKIFKVSDFGTQFSKLDGRMLELFGCLLRELENGISIAITNTEQQFVRVAHWETHASTYIEELWIKYRIWEDRRISEQRLNRISKIPKSKSGRKKMVKVKKPKPESDAKKTPKQSSRTENTIIEPSAANIGPHLPGSPITTLSDSVPTIKLDELPLNQHGKINYDKLARPGQAHGDPMKHHMNSKKNRFDKMK